MKELLCYLGFHKWNKWKFRYSGYEILKILYQTRECPVCGTIKIKQIR